MSACEGSEVDSEYEHKNWEGEKCSSQQNYKTRAKAYQLSNNPKDHERFPEFNFFHN
jgi:hypothetical protein